MHLVWDRDNSNTGCFRVFHYKIFNQVFQYNQNAATILDNVVFQFAVK